MVVSVFEGRVCICVACFVYRFGCVCFDYLLRLLNMCFVLFMLLRACCVLCVIV